MPLLVTASYIHQRASVLLFVRYCPNQVITMLTPLEYHEYLCIREMQIHARNKHEIFRHIVCVMNIVGCGGSTLGNTSDIIIIKNVFGMSSNVLLCEVDMCSRTF